AARTLYDGLHERWEIYAQMLLTEETSSRRPLQSQPITPRSRALPMSPKAGASSGAAPAPKAAAVAPMVRPSAVAPAHAEPAPPVHEDTAPGKLETSLEPPPAKSTGATPKKPEASPTTPAKKPAASA